MRRKKKDLFANQKYTPQGKKWLVRNIRHPPPGA